MASYGVLLTGGIGNIIQTIPFMNWLKQNGHDVTATYDRHAYCQEICEMAAPSYHRLSETVHNCDYRGNMLTTDKGKRLISKMPEWAAWFIFHGFDVPDMVETPLDFEEVECPSRVVLAPCCKPNWPMKRWPHWQGLVNLMPGCAVVGLPTDAPGLKGDFKDLRKKTSLRVLAGMLADADYVIAEEGGIAHLACAVGTRTYVLYGGTDPVKNAQPNNAIQLVSSEPFACRPCQNRGWYYENTPTEMIAYGCRKNQLVNNHVRCMSAMTPYEVMKAVADNGDWWIV